MQGYLAPPIFVVFFLGVFFKRLNAQGCLAAMVVGFVIGIFRMVVDTPGTMKLTGFEHGYAPGSFLWIVNNIYFQYFSVLITVVSAVVMVAVSCATAAPPYAKIQEPHLSAPPRRKPPRYACKLGLAQRAEFGGGAGGHPRRLPLFPPDRASTDKFVGCHAHARRGHVFPGKTATWPRKRGHGAR